MSSASSTSSTRSRAKQATLDARVSFKTKLLEKVDARYLAPKKAYKLYQPHPKIAGFESLNVKKFMKIVQPIIVELANDDNVDTYIKQMKLVLKKRRDYHRSYWRIHKKNAPLVHGGQLPNLHDDSSDEEVVAPKKRGRPKKEAAPKKRGRPKKEVAAPKKRGRPKKKPTPRRSPRSNKKPTPRRSPRSNQKPTPHRSPRSNKKSTLRRSPRAKKNIFTVHDSDNEVDDVDSLFLSSDETEIEFLDGSPKPQVPKPQESSDETEDEKFIRVVEPVCWDCSTKIKTAKDCFPPGSWGNFACVLFRCAKCWKEHSKISRSAEKQTLVNRQALRDTLVAAHKESKATKRTYPKVNGRRTKTRTAEPICKFEVGDNVRAFWPDKTSKTRYPAQIFRANKKKYDVYFPQDGEVLKNVPENELLIAKKTSYWSRSRRGQFVNMGSFLHEQQAKNTPRKFGRFKPVKMGTGRNINKYVCSHDKDGKTYLFDMGYVQCKLLLDVFPMDEQGNLHDKTSIYE